MAGAQGIATQVKRVKQSALGSAGSSGSRLMRRVTFTPNKTNETYASNEIVDHQQSTGATQGPGSITGTLSGELSPGSYDLEFANILRRDFTAPFAAITSVALTIAGSGPTYTVERGTGSYLTDGVKNGMVVRLSVGTLNAANISKNLLVVGTTATVMTVLPLNLVAMVAEGPVAGCTVSAPGKATYAPPSGHTNDYFSWEKWFTDISRSELYVDCKAASAQVTLPATGIPTVEFGLAGLSRTKGSSEVLTSPTAATTTNQLQSVFGRIILNGVVTPVTNIQATIDGLIAQGEPEVGSNASSDLQRGKVTVTGSFSAKFTSATIQDIRDDQTVIPLIFGAAESASDTANFIVFCMPTIKIMTDDADDGEKVIVRTYNFTAQYNGAGGSGTDTNQTICQIHDSQAS